jgi:hypothetical protein
MAWIEALRAKPELWQEFKEDLDFKIRQETDRILATQGYEQVLVQKGIAKGLLGFFVQVTGEEREDNARAVRRNRETGQSREFRIEHHR